MVIDPQTTKRIQTPFGAPTPIYMSSGIASFGSMVRLDARKQDIVVTLNPITMRDIGKTISIVEVGGGTNAITVAGSYGATIEGITTQTITGAFTRATYTAVATDLWISDYYSAPEVVNTIQDYAHIYSTDDISETITTALAWELMDFDSGTDVATMGNSDNFTVVNERMTYTGSATKLFKVTMMGYYAPNLSGQRAKVGISKNSADPVTGSWIDVLANGTEYMYSGLQTTVSLSTNDYIEPYCTNTWSGGQTYVREGWSMIAVEVLS